MIHTKEFSLLKKEYISIVMLTRLKKYWWLYLLLFIIGVMHLKDFGVDKFSTFITVFSFAYPFITFGYLYFWSNSRDHNPIFHKAKLSFDDAYLYFERNGNASKITANSIQKVISNKKYWLIYIAKSQFIYIPKTVFYNDEDCSAFSSLITP